MNAMAWMDLLQVRRRPIRSVLTFAFYLYAYQCLFDVACGSPWGCLLLLAIIPTAETCKAILEDAFRKSYEQLCVMPGAIMLHRRYLWCKSIAASVVYLCILLLFAQILGRSPSFERMDVLTILLMVCVVVAAQGDMVSLLIGRSQSRIVLTALLAAGAVSLIGIILCEASAGARPIIFLCILLGLAINFAILGTSRGASPEQLVKRSLKL